MGDAGYLHGCEPPWRVWPRLPPGDLSQYLKQGETEAWFDQQWRPFWNALSPEQRRAYLDFWHAPSDWREAIAFHFELDTEFDREEDAREADALLSAERRQPPAQAGFLSRLFRR